MDRWKPSLLLANGIVTLPLNKIAKILESLKQSDTVQFGVEIYARSRDEAHNLELFKKIIDIMAKQGVCFGPALLLEITQKL